MECVRRTNVRAQIAGVMGTMLSEGSVKQRGSALVGGGEVGTVVRRGEMMVVLVKGRGRVRPCSVGIRRGRVRRMRSMTAM